MKKIFADLHCHPTMHPFAFEEADKNRKNSLWSDNKPKKRQRDSAYPEYFQTSMPALARGNVKLVVAALYPLEQSWLDPKILGEGDVSDFIAKFIVSHLPIRYINTVQSDSFNYFEYLQKEYAFLLKDHDKTHSVNGENWKYVLAKDAMDIEQYESDENVIIVIPSIEGAHSLISSNADQIIHDPAVHQSTLSNIQKIKTTWDYVPLYVTMSHHFYNGMLGQARSIPDGAASFLLHQQVGLNEPVNPRGEEVIDCLLGIGKYKGNGKRILIDTKHMSVSARLWYYNKIAKYNEGLAASNKIPIIASHMGYGTHDTTLDSITLPDTDKEKYEKSTFFNPWSINLSKEEIRVIVDSGGIIGLNLDQRILSGDERIEKSKNFSNHDIKNNTKKVVQFWTRQIGENIIEIAKAVVDSELSETEKTKVWNSICLGTDFDGMINPVDSFIVADEYKNLMDALLAYFTDNNDFKALTMGLSIETILEKIMYQNVYDFVIRNYK